MESQASGHATWKPGCPGERLKAAIVNINGRSRFPVVLHLGAAYSPDRQSREALIVTGEGISTEVGRYAACRRPAGWPLDSGAWPSLLSASGSAIGDPTRSFSSAHARPAHAVHSLSRRTC